jgi:hypothetical protein
MPLRILHAGFMNTISVEFDNFSQYDYIIHLAHFWDSGRTGGFFLGHYYADKYDTRLLHH